MIHLLLAASIACPLTVEHVYSDYLDKPSGNYDVLTGVAFQNTSDQTMRAIKWKVSLLDDFGSEITYDEEISRGTFAPHVTIEPKRALNGTLQTSSDFQSMNAWVLTNARQDVKTVYFQAVQILFADGSQVSCVNPAGG